MNKKTLYYITSGLGFFLLGASWGFEFYLNIFIFCIGLILMAISFFLDNTN